MRPNWQNAPEWANWVAMDKCGDWFWFEEKPLKDQFRWVEIKNSKYEFAEDDVEWDESLEKRPLILDCGSQEWLDAKTHIQR